jgi:hypothetical protein
MYRLRTAVQDTHCLDRLCTVGQAMHKCTGCALDTGCALVTGCVVMYRLCTGVQVVH